MELHELPYDLRQIAAGLKKKWNNIFLIKTRDGEFIFRTLTRKEYLEIVDLYPLLGESSEDTVFEQCVLYPKVDDIEKLYAGTVTVVVDSIIDISGFSEPDVFMGLLESNRKIMELADSQMIVVLLKAFPHLTLESINNLDIQQLTYYLALAEQVLGVTITIDKEKSNNTESGSPINFAAENREMGRNPG